MSLDAPLAESVVHKIPTVTFFPIAVEYLFSFLEKKKGEVMSSEHPSE